MPPSDNPNRHSSPSWRDMRHWVITRDNNVCNYCGETGHQVDYCIPPAHGGTSSPENLVCCCISCLNASNDAPYPTFADKVAYIKEHRKPVNKPKDIAKTVYGVGPKPYGLQPQPVKIERRLAKFRNVH